MHSEFRSDVTDKHEILGYDKHTFVERIMKLQLFARFYRT